MTHPPPYDTLDHTAHGGGIVKMWTRHVPVEDGAKQQLMNVSTLPFIHSHVAAMPDVHWGMGATVGDPGPRRPKRLGTAAVRCDRSWEAPLVLRRSLGCIE